MWTLLSFIERTITVYIEKKAAIVGVNWERSLIGVSLQIYAAVHVNWVTHNCPSRGGGRLTSGCWKRGRKISLKYPRVLLRDWSGHGTSRGWKVYTKDVDVQNLLILHSEKWGGFLVIASRYRNQLSGRAIFFWCMIARKIETLPLLYPAPINTKKLEVSFFSTNHALERYVFAVPLNKKLPRFQEKPTSFLRK